MGQFIDMTGQTYGDLTVIERDNNKKKSMCLLDMLVFLWENYFNQRNIIKKWNFYFLWL